MATEFLNEEHYQSCQDAWKDVKTGLLDTGLGIGLTLAGNLYPKSLEKNLKSQEIRDFLIGVGTVLVVLGLGKTLIGVRDYFRADDAYTNYKNLIEGDPFVGR